MSRSVGADFTSVDPRPMEGASLYGASPHKVACAIGDIATAQFMVKDTSTFSSRKATQHFDWSSAPGIGKGKELR